jgi:hypothetical protein
MSLTIFEESISFITDLKMPQARREEKKFNRNGVGVHLCKAQGGQVLQSNILQRVSGRIFPQPPLTQGFLKAAEKENRIGYFPKCFVAGRVGPRWGRYRTSM